MAALEQGMWQDFVLRAADHVRGMYPLQIAGLSTEQLCQQVESSLARARKYGFEGHYDLFRYLALVYGLGSEFDRDGRRKWVREVLDERAYSPHTKMDLLTQLAAPELGLAIEDAPIVFDVEENEPVDD